MPSRTTGWHSGELAVHKLLKVPTHQNPTSHGLPSPYGYRVMQSSLLALGTLDAQGRPWTTIWGGERGFARPIAEDVLGVKSAVDLIDDPVFKALWSSNGSDDIIEGGVVQPNNGEGKIMAALSIDLETRDRVKLAGRMIAGAVVRKGDDGAGELQMAVKIDGSLGNCPKYLNKKDIRPHTPQPTGVREGLPLNQGALKVIEQADLFFLSSTAGESMDTNHRGGSVGLVRVIKNDEEGVELIYPEFSGNRLYQTLGNLQTNPLVGIAIPDFETSNVLFVTGTASILVGPDASAYLPRTKLAVKITVSAAVFIRNGLPFRGSVVDYSPYNPPVHRLVSELDSHAPETKAPELEATLTRREVLSPTVNRFTFKLSSTQPLPVWKAGQHITLDFGPELDHGWSHMRDEDPQSLNDDYVRTFTVSSVPPAAEEGMAPKEVEVQITARRNGPATRFLWSHNLRIPLGLPVLGFGGEDKFHIPLVSDSGVDPVFIAGGVGITPLLAQARGALDAGSSLRVLWSLRGQDLPLAIDAFEKTEGLAKIVRLFVTGSGGNEAVIAKLRGMGTVVEKRRMEKTDLGAGLEGRKRKFFLCTGPGMLSILREWLEGEDVVWEDFGY